MLKNRVLLVSYYTHLISIEQNCTTLKLATCWTLWWMLKVQNGQSYFCFHLSAVLWAFWRVIWYIPNSLVLEMAACQSWKCKKALNFTSYLHFQLWPATISKPVQLGKSHLPLWKSQSSAIWNKKMKFGMSALMPQLSTHWNFHSILFTRGVYSSVHWYWDAYTIFSMAW